MEFTSPDQKTTHSTPTASTPSPPMVGAPAQNIYNAVAMQESPEEFGLGGLGTSMGWESNWQGIMQQLQLGVQDDNYETF